MAYYATLAAKGFIPEAWLADWASYDSPLGHHPDRVLVPGVEISSGSLGHGLPLAVGTALGLRAQGIDARVVVLVGDAELDEGSNAEAIALAGALGLDRAHRGGRRQRLDQLPPARRDRRRGSRTRAGTPRWWTAATTTRSSGALTDDGPADRPWSWPRWRRSHDADPRQTFARTAAELVEEDPSVALVYAEISGQYFRDVERAHPDRVVNVGIREQLLVNVGAGLALSGMRPIVHTFARSWWSGPSSRSSSTSATRTSAACWWAPAARSTSSSGGRTHQVPGDVALLDTLPGWTVHVPGHADEVDASLRRAVAGDGRDYVRVVGQQNAEPLPGRRPAASTSYGAGPAPRCVAVGPMLDAVLAAVEGLDVTVLYANTVRPFDAGDAARRARHRGGGGAGRALPGRHVGSRLVGDALVRRTAPAAGARGAAARSCGGTARPPSTTRRTASTPGAWPRRRAVPRP